MAAAQFDRVADALELDQSIRDRCKWPKRIVTVTCPVQLDDGRVETFFGHRVQHHLSRGPTKGGLRYHPKVSIGEVAALAMWMNWKCALAGLPYGGGKGGITCDPTTMSYGEQERLTRRFTMEMIPFIGVETDVMAPDMGTNEQTMAWILDTYSTHAGYLVPGIVTGKPVGLQGTEGRTEATGRGVGFLVYRVLDRLGISSSHASAVIQGFGNVGRHAALTLAAYGVKVMGISDVKGAVWNESGIDVKALCRHVDLTGSVVGYAEAEAMDPEEMLLQECDALIPAAVERVINGENAGKLQCRVLAEAANGPTTPDADLILEERGDVFVIPDILCNAGGVIVSYFEWVQNLQRFNWSRSEVLTKLETKLQQSLERVIYTAEKRGMPFRMAATALGVEETAGAKGMRGLFP
ncbi:Glu/Leu/Phe/Val dehydrogenase [Sulfuriroseicoccus oceanibius]|uniref:Glutamate dehydrogenase n=2 Tax=Sulfuriroseicoccus oceanibius TaxID=2707525 RepID=A0A6B3L9G2_9BACT|nr:Glu/Leu/Phe/Val dehydrogenase [Sulfuriroseicoccus oceanibius]